MNTNEKGIPGFTSKTHSKAKFGTKLQMKAGSVKPGSRLVFSILDWETLKVRGRGGLSWGTEDSRSEEKLS